MKTKNGLPDGCIRLLLLCAQEEPIPLLDPGDASVAAVLATQGYLELLPGCKATYGITEKGERLLASAPATPHHPKERT